MTGLPDPLRTALQHELDTALQKRERLNVYIDMLSERLGINPSTAVSDDGGAQEQSAGPVNDPVAAVNPAQFYGFKAGRAAREVLAMAGKGRPLRTTVIFNAVKKGDAAVKDAEILSRAMRRHKEILRVGRGLWGLKEWYPPNTPEWTPGEAELQPDDAEPELDLSENGQENGGDESEIG